MGSRFYTIGHSTSSLMEFASVLKEFNISLVADVRAVPRSRTNPQFNRESMAGELAPWAIEYEHYPELGGLRGHSHEVGCETNGFWTNESFHNYADYATSAAFCDGLERLRSRGKVQSLAIMCAEAVWWRCHRRIIADHLMAAGEIVCHIVGRQVRQARMTDGAIVSREGMVSYPVN
jgi:uncharacterized protein (DUF488 family)